MTTTRPVLACCLCAFRVLREVLWFVFIILKALTLSLAAAWDAFWDTLLDAFFQRIPKATAEDVERLRRAFYANAAQQMEKERVADFPRADQGQHFPRSA